MRVLVLGAALLVACPESTEYEIKLIWRTTGTDSIQVSPTTPEMIERNAPRFCTLMGLTAAGPWMQDGPDPARLGMGPLAGSQFE